jgi:DNA-directed RNA polymerase II subunit RPB2
MWNASVDELVLNHCIEYVDAREQEWLYLAESVEKVNMRKQLLDDRNKYKNDKEKLEEIEIQLQDTLPYSHCEIDPASMLSVSANLNPQAHRQAGPRTSFQCGMSRQALTQYHSNEYLRFDTSYKMMYYPTKPLFQTDMQETTGSNALANGQLLQVAILAHPDNAEDGIVFKEEAIKYGNKLDMCKKFTYISALKIENKNIYIEKFGRPPIKPGEPEGRYSALDEKGIPILDAYIRPFDCVIGKIKEYNKAVNGHNVGDIENISEFAGVGEEGYIDRVLITTTEEGEIIMKVKVRQNRKYIPGDKLACMTPEHEVLTSNRGWVKINEVELTDDIVTLNDKHEREIHKPKGMFNYSTQGEKLFSIETNDVSMKITQNHRLYCSTNLKEWKLEEAHIVANYPEIYLMNDENKTVKVESLDFKEIICEESVHCISVPNETFLVRHNGKIHWTGNSRYSQKGTISRILPARELPRVSTGPLKGMVPDILINPHSQPSRMTMNKIIEILVNKAACINGKFYNATTFRNFDKELDEVQSTLKNYGLDPMGNEYFEFPDGTPFKTKVFFGPCFYQALRHHVNDKIQMRSRKGVKPSTRQPMSGRSNEGGLKVGEMERDALISHGSSGLLLERLLHCSDIYNVVICSTCGTFAITKNVDNDPNPNVCQLCGPKAKFGVITIPYVLKLLIFYLMTAGILVTFKTKEIQLPNNRKEEEFLS